MKESGPIAFADTAGRDNPDVMTNPAKRPFPTEHPLLQDRPRLETISDLMWWQIQKTIAPGHRPRARRSSPADLTIAGGIVVSDVLAVALAGLLYTPPTQLRESWEALATSIAHNKAVQAVRDNTKGRIRAQREIDLASLDREDEEGTSPSDKLVDELANPEAEAIALRQQLILRRLAEEHLGARDRDIYFRIHHLGQTRVEICDDYDISPQAVGQIYTKSARKLHELARQDDEFLIVSDPDINDSARGGNR